MSNFIFNDNFDDQGREPIRVFYNQTAKKRTPVALFVCTALIVIAGLMFLLGGAFNLISSKVEANVPEINNTISYVSNDVRGTTTTLSGDESRVDVIARIKDSVVEISTASGSAGSGVIVGEFSDDKGGRGYLVITNAHVVQSGNQNMYVNSYVTLTDGTKYQTQMCGFDAKSDIAVLKIYESSRYLPVATWANGETTLNVGESVIVIGNPLGVLGGSVTNGYLSALDREIKVDGHKMNLLQTDAAVNPGNSGGGLFNLNGELIGIVNAKIVDEDIEGIGFAIPYDDAYKAYYDLTNYGYIKGRPTVGADWGTNYRGYVEVYNAESKSELKDGDIIRAVRVNGSGAFIEVTASSLTNLVSEMEIGDTFELKVQRGAFSIIVKVTVYEYTE
jgi:serine protease Do